VIAKTSSDSWLVFEAIRSSGGESVKNAAQNFGLEVKDFDLRLDIWAHSIIGIFQGVFVTQKLSPKEADKALGISLLLLGLDEVQAKRLTSKPINIKKA
jgi:hypothetical protein